LRYGKWQKKELISTAPLAVDSFVGLVAFMKGKVVPQQRKTAFDSVMALEKYKRENILLAVADKRQLLFWT
jgi:hypothetical protein